MAIIEWQCADQNTTGSRPFWTRAEFNSGALIQPFDLLRTFYDAPNLLANLLDEHDILLKLSRDAPLAHRLYVAKNILKLTLELPLVKVVQVQSARGSSALFRW